MTFKNSFTVSFYIHQVLNGKKCSPRSFSKSLKRMNNYQRKKNILLVSEEALSCLGTGPGGFSVYNFS